MFGKLITKRCCEALCSTLKSIGVALLVDMLENGVDEWKMMLEDLKTLIGNRYAVFEAFVTNAGDLYGI